MKIGSLMRTLELSETNLEQCVKQARSGSVLVIRNGKPVTLVTSVAGLDVEQIELGTSAKFWKLIEARRCQKTISRAELQMRLAKLDE